MMNDVSTAMAVASSVRNGSFNVLSDQSLSTTIFTSNNPSQHMGTKGGEANATIVKLHHSIYSFVAWISSIFAYICFLVWAFLPGELLHSVGITYYPSRYYAIALPAYAIALYMFATISYIGVNLFFTLEPDDLGTVFDVPRGSLFKDAIIERSSGNNRIIRPGNDDCGTAIFHWRRFDYRRGNDQLESTGSSIMQSQRLSSILRKGVSDFDAATQGSVSVPATAMSSNSSCITPDNGTVDSKCIPEIFDLGVSYRSDLMTLPQFMNFRSQR